MKHLKVRAVLTEDKTQVVVTILEQTHRENEFGNGADTFNAGNITLSSLSSPDWYNYGDEAHVCVRGGSADRDLIPIIIPIERWKEVKEAIEAYNEWGRTQP